MRPTKTWETTWCRKRERGGDAGPEENIAEGKKGAPVTWLHLPLPPLPAFSLFRVTLGRSSILIGSPRRSPSLIGWIQSLLHYRYMPSALPVIRNDWEKLIEGGPSCQIWNRIKDWSKQKDGFEIITIRVCFCHLARVCCHKLFLLGFFYLRHWFVEFLKMHQQCLPRAIMIPC